LGFLDDIGDGEGLAGAGGAEQGLELVAMIDPFHQGVYRCRLVTRRSEIGYQFELRHD